MMMMLDTNDNAPRHWRSEDVFLAWLFSLPESMDVAEAARLEIARIDSVEMPSERVSRLRTMLMQACAHQPTLTRNQRRQRH